MAKTKSNQSQIIAKQNTDVTRDGNAIHVKPTAAEKKKPELDVMDGYLLVKNPTAKQTSDVVAALIAAYKSWVLNQ